MLSLFIMFEDFQIILKLQSKFLLQYNQNSEQNMIFTPDCHEQTDCLLYVIYAKYFPN